MVLNSNHCRKITCTLEEENNGRKNIFFQRRVFLAANQQPKKETLYILQNALTIQPKDITGKDNWNHMSHRQHHSVHHKNLTAPSRLSTYPTCNELLERNLMLI